MKYVGLFFLLNAWHILVFMLTLLLGTPRMLLKPSYILTVSLKGIVMVCSVLKNKPDRMSMIILIIGDSDEKHDHFFL